MIEGIKTGKYAFRGIDVVSIVRGKVYENFTPEQEAILVKKGFAEYVETKELPEEGFSLDFALMLEDKIELQEYAAKYGYDLSARKKLKNMKTDLENMVG